MIYIDPPYNTGNDFIYADDFMRSQDEETVRWGCMTRTRIGCSRTMTATDAFTLTGAA